MGNSAGRLLVGGLLAVVLPGVALHAAAGADRHAAGLTAAPFVVPRVFAAHLLASLPLAILLAGRVRAKLAADFSPAVWVLVGGGVLGLAAYITSDAGDVLVGAGVGPVSALLLRSAAALVLVFPWCVAAGFVSSPLRRPEVVVAALVAVVPPGAFAESLAAARTKAAEELLSRDRFARAEVAVRVLAELGSDRPVAGKSPADARKAMGERLGSLRKAAKWPLPANPPPAAVVRRAAVLIQLSRDAEAAALLEPLAARNPEAAVLLGHAYMDLGRGDESAAAFEVALGHLLPLAATGPNARAVCVDVFGALVLNARDQRRYDEVERLLRRGLDALPHAEAHFRFELGKLYAETGRPADALGELNAAAGLDPDKFAGPVRDVVAHLRTHTYGCVLSSPGQPASR